MNAKIIFMAEVLKHRLRNVANAHFYDGAVLNEQRDVFGNRVNGLVRFGQLVFEHVAVALHHRINHVHRNDLEGPRHLL
jgi:hypothetical protein